MNDKKKLVILLVIFVIIILVAVVVTKIKTKEVTNVDSETFISAEENHTTDFKNTETKNDNSETELDVKILDVNESNFESEVLKSDKKVIIDFYADWCGPCQRLSPIIDEVAKENSDVKFVRIDVDTNDNLMVKYGVRSIPTLIVIENGEEVNRSVGLISKERIEALINKNKGE